MQGEYDLGIVLVSYLVAVLASFTALEFAGKVLRPGRRIWPWVLSGSVAMGTGIWSMHFVGMEAFKLPIDIAYDIPLTILSWVAAVAVSALALWALSRLRSRSNRLDPRIVVPSGLLMAAGICTMHYSGMYAMGMSPGITYDPVLLVASFLIAASASVVTLMIAVALREITRLSHLLLRIGAALVMGVAIAGMHYTGMAAASFAPDALCTITGGLEAGWTVGPVTLVTAIILVAALLFSYRDTRAIRLRAEQERLAQLEAERRAFEDPTTGLYNRAWLTRELANRQVLEGERMSVVLLESATALSASASRALGAWLKQTFPNASAAVLQPGVHYLVVEGDGGPAVRQMLLAKLPNSHLATAAQWRVGIASCPEHARTPFRLLSVARSVADAVVEPGEAALA